VQPFPLHYGHFVEFFPMGEFDLLAMGQLIVLFWGILNSFASK
jgi:hypothetical protein